jgi:hypothetical protein
MKTIDTTPFSIVTELNYPRLMLFLLMMSFADKEGKVQISLLKLLKLLNGVGSNKERPIVLTSNEFRDQLKKMTYLGILRARGSAEPNHKAKTVMYQQPICIQESFIHFMPRSLLSGIDSQEVLRLKTEIREDTEHAKKLNQVIRRLRREVKLSHVTFIPEFKMENKDGSINKRSVEFRKLWAWFILLEIDRAFERVNYKTSDPENPIKDLDYGIMAMWLSKYGLENIEGLLAKFYGNQRLTSLKEEAGETWPTAVKQFIFASLKRQKQGTKNESQSTNYKSRRPERDPGKDGNQITMPGSVQDGG